MDKELSAYVQEARSLPTVGDSKKATAQVAGNMMLDRVGHIVLLAEKVRSRTGSKLYIQIALSCFKFAS